MAGEMVSRPRTGKYWAMIIVLLLVAGALGYLYYTKAAPAAQESVVARIERTGKLVVATEAAFPPFEVVNVSTNEIEGFDVDIAREVAGCLGVQLEMRNMAFASIFTSVEQGTVDLGISAITITAERDERVDFSNPYFFSNLTILTLQSSPIADPADLQGVAISLQEGTTSDFWVADVLMEAPPGGLGVTPSDVQKTQSFTDAVQLTLNGDVDATIIDQPAAEAFVQADPSLKIAYVIVTNEAFGIAIPPGEGVLQGAVNTCLRMLRLSGRYDAIVTDWFG